MSLRDSSSGVGAYQTSSFLLPEPRGECSQEDLHPHLDTDIGVAVGSRPSREESGAGGRKAERVSPSPSDAPPNGKLDNNVNASTLPTHVPEVLHPNQNVGPQSAAADENKSSFKYTISLLHAARESSDAFPPLKSIAGDLCSILENPERTTSTEKAVGSLAPRIRALAQSLYAPVSAGDIDEEERRNALERKLEDVHRGLVLLVERGKVKGFLENAENAQRIDDLVEDIHEALMKYQISLQQDIHDKDSLLIEPADLVLLKGTYLAADAGYLGGSREGCLRGTRKGVLWEIERWLTGKTDRRVFWLHGLAGTGKSAIAQTFAGTAFADGRLGASFFCSRGSEDRSNLQAIFPTLAFQLAFRYPRFREELLRVLKVHPDVGRESLSSQMKKVIVGPLKVTGISTLIIIDALDECRDEEPASSILSILSRFVDEIPNVKFFITGRPEPQIRSGFRLQPLARITEVLKLHEVKSEAVNSDIERFFRTQLTALVKRRSVSDLAEDWPSSSDMVILCEKAGGFFFYASTVVDFVASKNHLPSAGLALVTSFPHDTPEGGKYRLDQFYTSALEQAFSNVHDDQSYSLFRTVVGAVLLIFVPLSIEGLSTLLGHHTSHILSTTRPLHSLLLVPDNLEDPVCIFHKSFPDFLTDPHRCKDGRFFVNPTTYHGEILFSCLNLMGERLKENICDLDDHITLGKVEDLSVRRKENIGDALEYACCFWTKHLLGIPGSNPHVNFEEVQRAVDNFFTRHLLYWIEVLALIGNLDIGVHSLNDVEGWYESTGIPRKWTNDSRRFLSENFNAIRDSPSQIYHSALPLCPASSWLRKYYSAELLREGSQLKGE